MALRARTAGLRSAASWSASTYLINNETTGMITMNGMWYILSNSTTDKARMDPLTDAEACTRDAALMHLLGINNIYIDEFDSTANHDDCFSIFNSVGIYVTVMLGGASLFSDQGEIDGAYTTSRFEEFFRRIDAVKDYENLLGIDVGELPTFDTVNVTQYADAQKIYRACIRDIKEYIHYNSPRPLLVGASIQRWEYEHELPMKSVFDHISCIVPDERISSASDFIGIGQDRILDHETIEEITKDNEKLAGQLDDLGVPVWLSSYSTVIKPGQNDENSYPTLQDTAILYNETYNFIVPNGWLSGGNRYGWANAQRTASASNDSFTRIDEDGNMQLTKWFDSLRDIFAGYVTETWLSGATISSGLGLIEPKKCNAQLITNYTSSWVKTSFTVATDWELPTRPPGLDAIITSGMQGPRGQMVDVLVTTIKHEIRDSKGEITADIVLSPRKSEPRTTTARATSGGTGSPASTPPSNLSTGVKAGIGAGVGIGGAIVLVVLGLFLLRRRRRKVAALQDPTKTNDDSDGAATAGNLLKAELATGPDVEAQPPAELPDQLVTTPKEVSGDAYPGIGMDPVELPVNEQPVEVPGAKPSNWDASWIGTRKKSVVRREGQEMFEA